MPILARFLEEYLTDLPVEERMLSSAEFAYTDLDIDLIKQFQNRAETAGIIIVAWESNDKLSKPTHYWYQHPEEILADWKRFDDQTIGEYPKIYKTFIGLKKAVLKLRERYLNRNWKIGLAFWTHPEIDFKQQERYLLMSGQFFPSSVRR